MQGIKVVIGLALMLAAAPLAVLLLLLCTVCWALEIVWNFLGASWRAAEGFLGVRFQVRG